MEADEKQLLYDVLMSEWTCPHTEIETLVTLEKIAHKTIDTLEPLIDGIMKSAKVTAILTKEENMRLEVLPDGDHCEVKGELGSFHFKAFIATSRLRALANFVLEQSITP